MQTDILSQSVPHEPVKKRRSALSIAVWTLIILSAIGSLATGGETRPRMCGFVDCNTASMEIARAQLAVEKGLRDPDSAEFRNTSYSEHGAVCGQLNARNGFGGLTGYQRFVYLAGMVSMEESTPRFGAVWNKLCVGKVTRG